MTEIDPGTRMMGAVPKMTTVRGGLGTPPPAPEPPDPHALRAARDGITRDEAKRRNMIDAYNAANPLPRWTPPPVAPYVPLYAPPNWAAGPQANASVVNQIQFGGMYRPRCNHVLHATLTVLTCGMWAPVWAVAWAVSRQGH
jgi:hypothetical protein